MLTTNSLVRSPEMNENVKALIAKSWKNELLELEPGKHYVDEMITIHSSLALVYSGFRLYL